MKLVSLMAIVASSLCAACMPRYIEVPPEPTKMVWVEREGEARHSIIGNSTSREIVTIDVVESKSLSPNERVIWVEGVDLKTSKFQRTHQRGKDEWSSLISTSSKNLKDVVDVYQFSLDGGRLSVEAQIQTEKFKPVPGARYYVEFLNSGPMTEEAVDQMLSAWKTLSNRLKIGGMNMSNIVMGGNKFSQDIDAIVIVKVGK